MRFLLAYIIILILPSIANAQISVSASGENQNIGPYDFNYETNTLTFSPGLDSMNTVAVWFNFMLKGYRRDTVLTVVEKAAEYVHRTNYLTISYGDDEYSRTKGTRIEGAVAFRISPMEDSVYLSTGYPYTYSRLQRYLSDHSNSKLLENKVLLHTASGLDVNLLTIKSDKGNDDSKSLIWIICRQHAFESVASYVMEGMMDYLLSPRCDKRILKKYIFKIVPMVDVESVWKGESGRMQKPRDYNRDWQKPILPTTQTLQQEIMSTAHEYNYRIFWDIHGTYPGGLINYGFSYFDLYGQTAQFENLREYWKKFEKIAGHQPIRLNDNAFTYDGMPADTWNKEVFPSLTFSTTIEVDWSLNHEGKPLSEDDLRKMGADMIRALRK